MNSPLDPSSASFLHASIILKRITQQRISRYRNNGLIPVPHADIIKVDLQHIPIHAIFGHLYPISHPDRIICRDLYTSDEAEYGIFEYQHKNSRCSTK